MIKEKESQLIFW